MNDQCIIHYHDITDVEVHPFTDKTIEKIYQSVYNWRTLNGEFNTQQELNIIKTLDALDQKLRTFKFHRRCYSRFSDKTRFAAALKRQQKQNGALQVLQEDGGRYRKLPHKKVSDKSTLFKEECIFCQRSKMMKKSWNLKRVYEPLSKCLTKEAEQKIKSQAKQKNDFKLLELISDQDLIACEAMYHKSCYKKFLYNPQSRLPGRPSSYDQSWNSFKFFVQKKLIEEKQHVSIQYLLKEFIKLVSEIEGLDAGNYTSQSLKLRLKKEFPQIEVFKQGSTRNESEMVCVPDNASQLVCGSSSASSSECYTTDNESINFDGTSSNWEGNIRKDLFYAAKHLANCIEKSAPLDAPWPPTAEHFDRSQILKMIPEDLLNFLAWLSGENDPFFDSKEEKCNEKILSIAQDLICLCKRGERHTPERMPLIVNVRHVSDSAESSTH